MVPARYFAPIVAASLMMGCGSGKVQVVEQACGIERIEPVKAYDPVMGTRTLAYDHNGDGEFDEAIIVTTAKNQTIDAAYLSSLPTRMWHHYLSAEVPAKDACWSGGETKEMTQKMRASLATLLSGNEF